MCECAFARCYHLVSPLSQLKILYETLGGGGDEHKTRGTSRPDSQTLAQVKVNEKER